MLKDKVLSALARRGIAYRNLNGWTVINDWLQVQVRDEKVIVARKVGGKWKEYQSGVGTVAEEIATLLHNQPA